MDLVVAFSAEFDEHSGKYVVKVNDEDSSYSFLDVFFVDCEQTFIYC